MVELELQLPLRSIDSRFFAKLPALPISVANKLAARGTEKSSKDFAGFDSNWLYWIEQIYGHDVVAS